MITQAIETRSLPATDRHGARIKAIAWAGSVTIPYDYSLNNDQVHRKAAQALADKMKWRGLWAQGGNAKGNGYVFVNIGGN